MLPAWNVPLHQKAQKSFCSIVHSVLNWIPESPTTIFWIFVCVCDLLEALFRYVALLSFRVHVCSFHGRWLVCWSWISRFFWLIVIHLNHPCWPTISVVATMITAIMFCKRIDYEHMQHQHMFQMGGSSTTDSFKDLLKTFYHGEKLTVKHHHWQLGEDLWFFIAIIWIKLKIQALSITLVSCGFDVKK